MIEQWLRDHVPGKWLTRGGKVINVYSDSNPAGCYQFLGDNGYFYTARGGVQPNQVDDELDLIAPVGVWLDAPGIEIVLPERMVVQWETEGGLRFLILDPTSPPELETWTEVKPVEKEFCPNGTVIVTYGDIDQSAAPAAFQYVSDAAADSVSSEVAGMLDGFRALCSRHDVVLRTREEWEALEAEVMEQARLLGCGSEREAQLMAERDQMGKSIVAKDAIIQDLHKQLREVMPHALGKRPGPHAVTGGAHRQNAQAVLSTTADYWQDARLGTQLPPGEPVEPMSARSWKRRMLP